MVRNVPAAMAIVVLAVVAIAGTSPAQAEDTPPQPPRGKAIVLLLGTFHFANPGLDEYKPQFTVDVLSKERQKEVAEVVKCLAAFRPTKIAVEALPSQGSRLAEEFKAYLKGDFELPANEIYQLGFRVAREASLTRVFPVDAPGRDYEPYVDPVEWAVSHDQADALTKSEKPWDQYFNSLDAYEDRLKTKQSLPQYLIHLNDPAQVLHQHGRYLTGTFKVGNAEEFPGPDAKMKWYGRNLRIFANVQRITDGPQDRILVIIGAGHLALLRHAFETSPEHKLVEVAEVLGPQCD